MILIQMHGHPGSGKSTIAKLIGTALPAVVLDKDVILSSMWEGDLPRDASRPASYTVLRAAAADILAQGLSVILDRPCFWPVIEAEGRALAARAGVPWAMVDCQCADLIERGHRLSVRQALPTQPRDILPHPGVGMYEPTCDRLIINTLRPVEENVPLVLKYLHAIEFAASQSLTANSQQLTAQRGVAR